MDKVFLVMGGFYCYGIFHEREHAEVFVSRYYKNDNSVYIEERYFSD